MAPPQISPIDVARERIAYWRADPAYFVSDVFHVEPTSYQKEAFKALAAGDHISISSGHGTGKTAFDAWTILHNMVCFYPVCVPCTAPTGHQLDDILWKELGRWHSEMGSEFAGLFDAKVRLFEFISNPNKSFAVGRTASRSNPEALQGFHMFEGVLCFILDEASGIYDKVFELSEGALSTRGAKVVMTSNPTRRHGYFYDSHHRFADEYACFKWSSEKSRLVDPAYPKRMARKYGRDSNVYRIRVLGEFPKQDADSVISYDAVMDAMDRDVVQVDGPMVWGLDVARKGKNASALGKRRMNVIPEMPKVWRNKDTVQLADLVCEEYNSTAREEKPQEIMIDIIGLGAGVYDTLRWRGLPAVAVNVAENASAHDRFHKLRDELWVRCAEWFDSRSVWMPSEPEDEVEQLIDELTAIKYDDPTSTGKTKIQSKRDIVDPDIGTHMESPDVADSIVLTFKSRLKVDAPLRKRRMSPIERELKQERPRLSLL